MAGSKKVPKPKAHPPRGGPKAGAASGAGARGEKLLGPVAAARYLQVSLSSVQRWMEAGAIPAFRTFGGHRRIRETDLAEFARREGILVAGGETAPPRLLVVDDDKDVREMLEVRARGMRPDIEVLTAENGFEAGRLVSERRPALVLLDIRLPGIPGVEVCRSIKGNPQTAGIHVVGITGSAKRAEIEALLHAGAEDCLRKPIESRILREILDRCLPFAGSRPGRPAERGAAAGGETR